MPPRVDPDLRQRRRRCSGKRCTSTSRMSSRTAGAPLRSSFASIASATSSRGASSSTRSPRSSRSVAPSPRTASVTRKPPRGRPRAARWDGTARTRGPRASAPPRWQARGRRRQRPGGWWSAPRARPCRRWRAPPRRPDRSGAPSRARMTSPAQRPSWVTSEVAASGSNTRMRSWVAASADTRAMRRPVAAHRRGRSGVASAPSSRPSASWPERSASNCTLSSWRSWTRAADSHNTRTAPSWRRRGRRRSCRPCGRYRVVRRERGRDPASGPVARRLGERRADQRHARARRGGHQGGVEPGGACADHGNAKKARPRRAGIVLTLVPGLFDIPPRWITTPDWGIPSGRPHPRAGGGPRAPGNTERAHPAEPQLRELRSSVRTWPSRALHES